MWPILAELDGHELGTFGVLLAAAVLSGLWVARRLGQRDDLVPRKVNDLGLITLSAAVLGSKALGVGVALLSGVSIGWEELRNAGAIHGGLLTAMLTVTLFARRYQMALPLILDAFIPAVALGQAIGRLGCLSAGCCFGTSSNAPWSITFVKDRAHELGGVPLNISLHPVQIYDAGIHILIFCLLYQLHRRGILRAALFGPWCIMEGCSRFLIEGFRGDLGRGVWLDISWLSTGRVTSLSMIAIGVTFLLLRRATSKEVAKA